MGLHVLAAWVTSNNVYRVLLHSAEFLAQILAPRWGPHPRRHNIL